MLNAFMFDWCLKVRVIRKQPIREFKQKQGQVLSLVFVDREMTQIQASFFNEAAVRFNLSLHVNRCYKVSNGRVKPSNKRYTSVPHDF